MGRIEPTPSGAKLIVDSPRPVDSAALTLAQRYDLSINSEDPQYRFASDMKDVTATVVRTLRPGLRVFIPRGGKLEVEFALNSAAAPQNVRQLLEDVVATANRRFPFAYRLIGDGDSLTFVPTATRNAEGRIMPAPALLDLKVSIQAGTRPVYESAKLMADALSTQTGFHVSCCQAAIAGIPWGMEAVPFEAHDEPARSVLTRLIHATRGRYFYLQRCDPIVPGRDTWCFINLSPLARDRSPF